MTGKYISYLLIISLFLIPASTARASVERKQTNDWNSLSSRLNEEIALKSKNQKTVFGILIKFHEDEITIQTSGTTLSQIAFKRAEVEKIWLAELKGERNIGKGAIFGAGAGAGAGLIYVVANRKNGDGQLAVSVPVLAIFGAAAGAAIGFFSRSRNQKRQLIYQR